MTGSDAFDDFQLDAVTTLSEFAARLHRLRVRADLALRRLEEWGNKQARAGRPEATLPRSSVAEALTGKRLPSRRLLVALLEACGVTPAEMQPWLSAWERVQLTNGDGVWPVANRGGPRPARGPEIGVWQFADDGPVTIVCAENHKPDDPDEVDFNQLARYTDLDALFELHGHLRATNPRSHVRHRPASTVDGDLDQHLVFLGDGDWTVPTAELLRQLSPPIRREPGGFALSSGGRAFAASVKTVDGSTDLLEDVAYVYRAPNPVNPTRTVTVCAGVYGRGVLGAVRALTDPYVRRRNEQHLRTRFAGRDTFSVLSRVRVFSRQAVTPDWSMPGIVLHEAP
jgi:hypothetical protein